LSKKSEEYLIRSEFGEEPFGEVYGNYSDDELIMAGKAKFEIKPMNIRFVCLNSASAWGDSLDLNFLAS
jgi:hypothetical protein